MIMHLEYTYKEDTSYSLKQILLTDVKPELIGTDNTTNFCYKFIKMPTTDCFVEQIRRFSDNEVQYSLLKIYSMGFASEICSAIVMDDAEDKEKALEEYNGYKNTLLDGGYKSYDYSDECTYNDSGDILLMSNDKYGDYQWVLCKNEPIKISSHKDNNDYSYTFLRPQEEEYYLVSVENTKTHGMFEERYRITRMVNLNTDEGSVGVETIFGLPDYYSIEIDTVRSIFYSIINTLKSLGYNEYRFHEDVKEDNCNGSGI